MNLIKCYQTNSNWYNGAFRDSKPIGILWHDTGGGNPYIKRYVQPSESDENYAELMELIGKNAYGNHWNRPSGSSGLNAWIGKLADGSVATIQAGEWSIVPWGCGVGTASASCNGSVRINGKNVYQGVHWIQFEICDDGYTDEEYLKMVYKEACELTAYLCDMFGIDPNGTVEFNGITVPTVLCHSDAHKVGLASNHSDVVPWFKKFGYSMDDARADVAKLLSRKDEEEPDAPETPAETTTVYVKDFDEAKSLFVDLLNNVIGFIVKRFSKD